MKIAEYYNSTTSNKVICQLCPHNCIISEGKSGICKVRKNISGQLYSMVYGRPVSVSLDPIEKKPLYHFYPGKEILSIGTVGCNMQCFFCQNSEISQVAPEEIKVVMQTPEEIINRALSIPDNLGIAYTYNEPVIFYEYMLDIAKLAHLSGLKNVMVSNGYINKKPLEKLLNFIDAFNIDLKSFNENFYTRYTHSTLAPVLNSIKTIVKSGKHIEITNLIIPGLNDNPMEFNTMLDWILSETGPGTVLHLSRYFPRYKSDLPPTPPEVIQELYCLAKQQLKYVYIGNYNFNSGNHTFCPSCKSIVIERKGYNAIIPGLDANGSCSFCGESILKYYKI